MISKQTQDKKIVTYQTWLTAKQILDSRKTNNIKIKQYPIHYTGLCRCGICGSKLTVCINNHGKYFSLRCMSHTIRAKENCKVSITTNTLYTHGLSLDDALYPILLIGLLKKLANTNTKDELEEKKVQLQNILNQEQKLTEMYLNGLLDSSVYESNLKNQIEKKKTIQQELIQLESEQNETDTERIRLLINKVVGRGLSYEQYHELIPYSIKDIVVYQDKVVVNTVDGPIVLRRWKERGILKLDEYIWSNIPPNYKIIYYKNKPNIYASKNTLFHTPNLTIQQLED